MTEAEVREFWRLFHTYHDLNGGNQRAGQAYMNALRSVAPELYAEASGSLTLDCFYNDSKISNLLNWLGL